MKQRTAQVAIEHIAIISVLIIITTVAILLFGKGPDTTYLEKKNSEQYWLTSPIGISSYGHEGSVFRIHTINNINKDISVSQITLEDNYETTSITVPTITLGPKETVTYNLSHVHDSQTKGRKYEYYVTFTYTDVERATTETFIGQAPLVGTVQIQNS